MRMISAKTQQETSNLKPKTMTQVSKSNLHWFKMFCLCLILWLTTEQMIPFDSQEARLLFYRLEILHVSLKVLTRHAQV